MIIIPIHKKIGGNYLPLVTLLLIVANCLIYLVLQGDIEEAFSKTLDYYHQSDLPKIEFPRYEQYRRDNGEDGWDIKLDHLTDQQLLTYFRLAEMERDGDFYSALMADQIVRPQESIYPQWKREREEFQSIQDSSFTMRYLLRYNELNWVNAFTHMFMHGSLSHLFGNMLFLLFLGILVEGALGGWLFLLCYLAAGLASVGASLWVHWGEYGGALGASGAIAGLMGLYTVLFGRRKVRFFYSLLFFFNYTKQPAIILLPFWLGWELWQFAYNEGSNVAYEAHAGGIVGGALLALLIKGIGLDRREFLDEESKRDASMELYAEAMEDLRELRVAVAKKKFKELLPNHGDDLQLLQSYFNACKLKPEHPDFHDAARRIFALSGANSGEHALVRTTFRDYVKICRGKLPLSPQERKVLALKLINWGHLQEARPLANEMLNQGDLSIDCAEVILALGRASTIHGEQQTARIYLQQTVRRFPGTSEAAAARQLLNEINGAI